MITDLLEIGVVCKVPSQLVSWSSTRCWRRSVGDDDAPHMLEYYETFLWLPPGMAWRRRFTIVIRCHGSLYLSLVFGFWTA